MKKTLTTLAVVSTALATLTLGPLATPAHAHADAENYGPQPTILADAEVQTPNGIAHDSATLGTRTVFAATTPKAGAELWVSDGTRTGTRMLKDLFPGTEGSRPEWFARLGNKIYFAATDHLGDRELWVTDGTPAGTVPALDLYPGATSSTPRDLIVSGDKLYFTAIDRTQGHELWVSNGTPGAATHVVEDIYSGGTGSFPSQLTRFKAGVVFRASTDVDVDRPFFTQGTPATTHALDGGTPPVVNDPRDFTVLGSQVLFSAYTPATGYELWTSNGGTGDAELVKDLTRDAASSAPGSLTVLGDQVLFGAHHPTDGYELWTSDGTRGGTQLLRDINEVPGDSAISYQITTHQGAAYFRANDGDHGYELWTSDGRPGGTRLVKDINPDAANSNPYGLASVGGRLFFSADDGVHGYELWTSTGKPDGTRMLADLQPGTGNDSDPYPVGTLGSTLLLGARVDSTYRVVGYTTRTSTTRAHPKKTYTRIAAVKRRIRVKVTVRAGGPGATPTGTITLRRGTKTIGRARLNTHGTAYVRITTRLRKGTHTMRATYTGSIHAQTSTTTVKVRIR